MLPFVKKDDENWERHDGALTRRKEVAWEKVEIA